MTDSSTSTQQTEQAPTDVEVLDGLDRAEIVVSPETLDSPETVEPAGSEIPPANSTDTDGAGTDGTEPVVDDEGTEDPAGEDPAGEDAAGEDEAGDQTQVSEDAAPAVPKRTRAQLLEREGEVAADFLETLLDIADLDGDIEVDIEGDRAAIAVVDSDEGRVPRRLVGPQGKVLEALQELTRLAVQTATGERSRLMLDVAGHRAARRTALVEIAKVAIADVKATGLQKALEDMTAFERKVVHDEVAAAGLDSESEGVEPHRHIVILPA